MHHLRQTRSFRSNVPLPVNRWRQCISIETDWVYLHGLIDSYWRHLQLRQRHLILINKNYWALPLLERIDLHLRIQRFFEKTNHLMICTDEPDQQYKVLHVNTWSRRSVPHQTCIAFSNRRYMFKIRWRIFGTVWNRVMLTTSNCCRNTPNYCFEVCYQRHFWRHWSPSK